MTRESVLAMTKGELWLKRRMEWLEKLERGEVKADLEEVDFTADLPKPLPREEAFAYYNAKLARYWRSEMEDFDKEVERLEKLPKHRHGSIKLSIFLEALRAAYELGKASVKRKESL